MTFFFFFFFFFFFSKNTQSFLAFESSNLKSELDGDIIIPNIYAQLY